MFLFCKPDIYVLVIIAESQDFEGSIHECGTNLFPNATNCNAIILSIKISDTNIIVSVFLSLNFNANAFNDSYCRLIVRDP